MYKKGGPLNLLTWLKGGYLKNMGAISGGPEKIWNKKQFLLHSPLQLKLWLVPYFETNQVIFEKKAVKLNITMTFDVTIVQDILPGIKSIVLRLDLRRCHVKKQSQPMRKSRGTQRQFSENICSEDDLTSRIFGTFVVKFLACLHLLRFSNI